MTHDDLQVSFAFKSVKSLTAYFERSKVGPKGARDDTSKKGSTVTVHGQKVDIKAAKWKRILQKLSKALFSHIGLAMLVSFYCVGGAFLFQHFEAPNELWEKEMAMNASLYVHDLLDSFLFELQTSSTVDNHTVYEWFTQYQHIIQEATHWGYKGELISPEDIEYGWSLPSALLFTVTIVTTIGYGHVCPVTAAGQIMVIPYALLGIPLMLMFLANIGEVMAHFFRMGFQKACCYICWRRRRKNEETYDEEKRKTRNRQRRESTWTTTESSKEDVNPPETRRSSLSSHEEDLEDAESDLVNLPVTLSIVAIVANLLLGTVLFAAWNDWSWVESAYFCFVTLSTIGFGDYVPGWKELGTPMGNFKLVISTGYIIFGMAVLSMCINLMMEEIIAKCQWMINAVRGAASNANTDQVIQFTDEP